MSSTHNQSYSVVVERFIRTSEGKIYKNLTANNRKPYLGYNCCRVNYRQVFIQNQAATLEIKSK